MHLKTILYSLTFIVLVVIISSCKKDMDIPEYAIPPEGTCVAGNSGEVTVILKPQHHGDPIPSILDYPDSAMIKFNVSEFPGDNPNLYDLVVVGEIGSDEVVVNNLSCGKYFIYMTGFDESIAERVRGGVPVTINETSGVITRIIPITED